MRSGVPTAHKSADHEGRTLRDHRDGIFSRDRSHWIFSLALRNTRDHINCETKSFLDVGKGCRQREHLLIRVNLMTVANVVFVKRQRGTVLWQACKRSIDNGKAHFISLSNRATLGHRF